jgi:uncharacterized protein YbaA (DUF1428 family)
MYVDGFVIPIPKKNIAAYKKMATLGAKVWKDHGALQYFECIGDDLNPKMDPKMKFITFPQLAKAKPTETVWFSFIIFKSKAHRNAVNKKVMADPRLANMKGPMPFDPNRMSYGGFKAVVKYG